MKKRVFRERYNGAQIIEIKKMNAEDIKDYSKENKKRGRKSVKSN